MRAALDPSAADRQSAPPPPDDNVADVSTSAAIGQAREGGWRGNRGGGDGERRTHNSHSQMKQLWNETESRLRG